MISEIFHNFPSLSTIFHHFPQFSTISSIFHIFSIKFNCIITQPGSLKRNAANATATATNAANITAKATCAANYGITVRFPLVTQAVVEVTVAELNFSIRSS